MNIELKQEDTKRFKEATNIIKTMSQEQARFALLLINQELRGYLQMPEIQQSFIDAINRAKKARD